MLAKIVHRTRDCVGVIGGPTHWWTPATLATILIIVFLRINWQNLKFVLQLGNFLIFALPPWGFLRRILRCWGWLWTTLRHRLASVITLIPTIRPSCVQAVGGGLERPDGPDQWRERIRGALAWRRAIQIGSLYLYLLPVEYSVSSIDRV